MGLLCELDGYMSPFRHVFFPTCLHSDTLNLTLTLTLNLTLKRKPNPKPNPNLNPKLNPKHNPNFNKCHLSDNETSM